MLEGPPSSRRDTSTSRPIPPALQRRNVVDYALQRRATLSGLRSGRVSAHEACDAHPHLQLAARHYGAVTGRACPVCQSSKLLEVHFVYGEELGKGAGQAKAIGELARMADRFEHVEVYGVEVCQSCGWNHLVRSFALGRGGLAHVADV